MSDYKSTLNDALSEKGALGLARQIREYWFRRGVMVEVWTEPGRYDPGKSGPSYWVVRSNINLDALRRADN